MEHSGLAIPVDATIEQLLAALQTIRTIAFGDGTDQMGFDLVKIAQIAGTAIAKAEGK